MGIAHFTFQFGLGDESGDRIDDQYINGAGAYQRVGDFQRLFAGIRLGNQQVLNVYADFFGIRGIQGVLGVDKRADAAFFLRLSHHA